MNPFPGPHHSMPLPDEYTPALIGIEGQTIKHIFQRTNCYIFIPRDLIGGDRVFQLSGGPEQVEKCIIEMLNVV